MVDNTLLGGGEDLRLDLLGHRIRHPRRLDPRLDRRCRSRWETQDLDRKKPSWISEALKNGQLSTFIYFLSSEQESFTVQLKLRVHSLAYYVQHWCAFFPKSSVFFANTRSLVGGFLMKLHQGVVLVVTSIGY